MNVSFALYLAPLPAPASNNCGVSAKKHKLQTWAGLSYVNHIDQRANLILDGITKGFRKQFSLSGFRPLWITGRRVAESENSEGEAVTGVKGLRTLSKAAKGLQ